MEEAEGFTEQSEEHVQHHSHSNGPRWITWVALSTAILGGLAAIASNFSGSNETEALFNVIHASNTWNHFQAKGIKREISKARSDIEELRAMIIEILPSDKGGHSQAKGIKSEMAKVSGDIEGINLKLAALAAESPNEKAKESQPAAVKAAKEETPAQKTARYEAEQEKIKDEASELEAEAKNDLHGHETFARAVTLFQVAIVVGAVSVLTKRRRYWIVSLVFGFGGTAFLVFGLLRHLGV